MSLPLKTLRKFLFDPGNKSTEDTVIGIIVCFFKNDLQNRPTTVRDIEERLQVRRSIELYDAINCARFMMKDILGYIINECDDEDDDGEEGKKYYFETRPTRPKLPRFLARLPDAHKCLMALLVSFIKMKDDVRVSEDEMWGLLRGLEFMNEEFHNEGLGDMRILLTQSYVERHFLIYEKDRSSGVFYFKCGRASVHADYMDMIILLTRYLFADEVDLRIGSLDIPEDPNSDGHGPRPPGPGPHPPGPGPHPPGSGPHPPGSGPHPPDPGSHSPGPGPKRQRRGPNPPESQSPEPGPSGSNRQTREHQHPEPCSSELVPYRSNRERREPHSAELCSPEAGPSGSNRQSEGLNMLEICTPGPSELELSEPILYTLDDYGNIICSRCNKVKLIQSIDFASIVVPPSLRGGAQKRRSTVSPLPITWNVPVKCNEEQVKETSLQLCSGEKLSKNDKTEEKKQTFKDSAGPSTESLPGTSTGLLPGPSSVSLPGPSSSSVNVSSKPTTATTYISTTAGPSPSTGAIRKTSGPFLMPSIDVYRNAIAALQVKKKNRETRRQVSSNQATSVVSSSQSSSLVSNVAKMSVKSVTSSVISPETPLHEQNPTVKSRKTPNSEAKNVHLCTLPNQHKNSTNTVVLPNENFPSTSSTVTENIQLEIQSAVLSIAESLKSIKVNRPSSIENSVTVELEVTNTTINDHQSAASVHTSSTKICANITHSLENKTVESKVDQSRVSLTEKKIESNLVSPLNEVESIDSEEELPVNSVEEKSCSEETLKCEASKQEVDSGICVDVPGDTVPDNTDVSINSEVKVCESVTKEEDTSEVEVLNDCIGKDKKKPLAHVVTVEVYEPYDDVDDETDAVLSIAGSSSEAVLDSNATGIVCVEEEEEEGDDSEDRIPLNLTEGNPTFLNEDELSSWFMETLEEELDEDDLR